MEILTSSLQEFWSAASIKSAATSTDTENGLTADFKRSVTWRPR